MNWFLLHFPKNRRGMQKIFHFCFKKARKNSSRLEYREILNSYIVHFICIWNLKVKVGMSIVHTIILSNKALVSQWSMMLSLCSAVDDVVLCCIILHRILLTLDLVAAKTLVVFYVMVLCKYVTGPIVCPNLNISSVMVNKLNDWLGDGAGARHRPWLLT